MEGAVNRNEAKVRVRLDTSQAKHDLSDLTRHGQAVTGRIGDGIKGAIGQGVRASGLANAGMGTVNAGIDALGGPLQQSAQGIMGEALGGWGSSIEHAALGDMGPEARAAAMVRDQAKEIFGQVAGRLGEIPPEAHAYRKAMMPILTEREKGSAMFDRDKEFRAFGVTELGEKAATSIAEGFKSLTDSMLRAMGGSGW